MTRLTFELHNEDGTVERLDTGRAVKFRQPDGIGTFDPPAYIGETVYVLNEEGTAVASFRVVSPEEMPRD